MSAFEEPPPAAPLREAAAPGDAGGSVDRWLDSAGVRLRYVDEGGGEPVILVHSYTSDLDSMWRSSGVLPALARDHRVIALDLRGHGKSGKPHAASAYGAHMAWDIARLLDHLHLARAHIVGYSLGGHVVAQLLTLAPERFATATLGGASGRRHWSDANDAQVELEADEMERGRLDAQILRLWPTGRPRPSPEELARLATGFLAGKDPLALAAVRRSNREQVIPTAALAQVNVPVLGLVGSRDPYRAVMEELTGVLRDFELVVIDGATHANAPSKPEFVATLRRFLQSHPMR